MDPFEGNEESIELSIPSKFGFEKVAAACAASIAQEIGFSKSKIEDLKTAVIEACLNAIEHGNKMDQNISVTVTIFKKKEGLVIYVQDFGKQGFNDSLNATPDLDRKIDGKDRNRGWGLFLIKNLIDKVEIRPLPNEGNRLELTLYL